MKLNRAQTGWMLYDPANAAYALIVRTVFAPLFFKFAADGVLAPSVATSWWGYTASAAGIVAGVVSILAGSAADRAHHKKRWLAGFVVSGTAATLALCAAGKGDVDLVLTLSFIGLGSYMAANSFYDSLLADVATRAERHALSSFAYAWGYIGGVIPFLACLALPPLGVPELIAVKLSFVIASLWWIALTLPLLIQVRERRRFEREANGGENTLLKVVKNRNARCFLISYFLYIDGVGTIYLMATPLALDVGVSTTGLVITILALQFLAFPCTLLYGKLAGRFGARLLVFVAIGVYILTALLALGFPLLASPRGRFWLFVAIAALVGSSQGGIQALSRSLFSRLVPAGNAAAFFGVYNFFGKFTTIVGPLLVGLAVFLWGRSEYGIALLALPFAAGAWGLSRVEFPGEAGK